MKAAGRVVWLTADVDTLSARVLGDATTAERRPDLTVGGRAEIEEMLGQRAPLYRTCADLVVPTNGRSPEQIVADIVAVWSNSSWTTAR